MQWRIQDFPEDGAPIVKWGRQSIILPNFPPKLHENDKIWTQEARPWRLPRIHQCWNQFVSVYPEELNNQPTQLFERYKDINV